MAVDYDAKIADAEARVKDLKRRKALAEQRQFVPVGKAFADAFSDVLPQGKREMKAFCQYLREMYDREHIAAPIERNEVDESDENLTF